MLPRRNVLVFHLGALGDFVLTWPLALALGRLHPQSRIICVTHAQKGALAEQALRLESADIDSGGWHALFGDGAALPAPSRKLLESAHSVYSFISDGADAWAKNTRAIAGEATIMFLRSPREMGLPAGESLVRQLADAPAAATAVAQILQSISQRGVAPRKPSDGSIIIHPGAGSAAKCWPAERFIELAAALSKQGRRVRFVMGEVEREKWPAGRIAAFERVGEVREPPTLVELHRTLQSASLVIGNDSGPGHLAGIIGIPSLILFGQSDPAIWKPLGPAVQILRHDPLADLSTEVVLDALKVFIAG
jgi:ADP-heptose:LPS heptosyltransferase